MFQGFKEFISRGNVIDLAVGVIIGASFATIVDAATKGFIDPLIATATGSKDPNIAFMVGPFNIGLILSSVINFLMKAAVVYFVIVLPYNRFMRQPAPPPPGPTEDQKLLMEIRDLLAKRAL